MIRKERVYLGGRRKNAAAKINHCIGRLAYFSTTNCWLLGINENYDNWVGFGVWYIKKALPVANEEKRIFQALKNPLKYFGWLSKKRLVQLPSFAPKELVL